MNREFKLRWFGLGIFLLVCDLCFAICDLPAAAAQEIKIPRKQTKPPNQPYTAAEAAARMKVPEGFSVEVVAAEPDLVNPVAMTFDERGRVWVTESVEYPRKPAGPGKDRVKILSDEDGDGSYETVKIFAEGLNIPSGIAVGYGGVWVANAPDILFYPDKDRDDVADGPPQVIVTGFGRADTHELPNSLTWGPDGFLYGLNGVFNPSKIVQNGKTHEFTCAMFRIHPRTHEFSLFCEGTSNPWGIAFNDVGDAFVSACVIDHLWHLVETGYYHRQGGPYPPFTWKLGSIVDYKHQMAAYCGLHWFDSDAYPEKYRKKLYMGNLHGSCINVDRLEKNGATYKGKPEGDFLTADDVWFMPIAQKTGPDGCLYILDWYDRYHCYQDANADPAGVDRLKGRLYRVRYQETARAAKFDLHAETDDQLIERLNSPNIYYRELAQRLLQERLRTKPTYAKLQGILGDKELSLELRLRALWSLNGDHPLGLRNHQHLWDSDEPALTAWSMRAAGNQSNTDPLQEIQAKIESLLAAKDTAPEVRLQIAIAAPKLQEGATAVKQLLDVIDGPTGDNNVLLRVVWRNLVPLLHNHSDEVATRLANISQNAEGGTSQLVNIMPHFLDWQLSRGAEGIERIASMMVSLLQRTDQPGATATIAASMFLTPAVRNRQITGEAERTLREALEPQLTRLLREDRKETGIQRILAVELLCHWKQPEAIAWAKNIALNGTPPSRLPVFDTPEILSSTRASAAQMWISSHDPTFLESLPKLITPEGKLTIADRRELFDALSQFDASAVATNVLDVYPQLETELKPAAVELLTSRVAWSHALLDAIAAEKLSKDAVNVNQIAKLLKSGDKKLAARVEQTWGKLRTERNPQREQVVADMKKLLVGSHGDPLRGQVVYMKLCGQCHKLHGTGQEVGPDITVNGRASFEQLLNNVFDPSLVIGNAYQGRTVVTSDGRVLSGLLVEDNPQRIVLKLQGGKLETIARGDVEEMEVSKLSLMPEGVEKQLSQQELIDLFALLKLDKAPTDPQAKPLPNFTELK